MITTTSADGTAIAADRTGSGPALVLVAPALATRTAFAPLAKLLAPHFTVYAYDRRGRGDSGDTPPYAADRESKTRRGARCRRRQRRRLRALPAGAVRALDAAAGDVGVTKLARYQPPFIVDGEPMPADFAAQLAALVAAERRGDALALWMRSTVRMRQEAIAQARSQPWWPAVEAGRPPRLRRDHHRPVGDRPATAGPAMVEPHHADAGPRRRGEPIVSARGAKALAGILPNATSDTFPGPGHGAPPEMVAPVLTRFFLAN